jgi:hypothetical protein
VVHHEALAAQEDQQTAVAEPTAFPRQRHQPLAQLRIVTAGATGSALSCAGSRSPGTPAARSSHGRS